MSLIPNERWKLLATCLNNCAVATFATAILTPTAGVGYGTVPGASAAWLFIGGLWFTTGIGLHVLAQVVLGRLRDD